jgi:hypothetical protein
VEETEMAHEPMNTQSAEQLVRAVMADRPPAEAGLALAELSSRVAVELHKLARAEAQARRGQDDWGAWAKLANAARTAVLQAASCRDAARELSSGTS